MPKLDFLHGGDIYAIRRKYPKEVIDFSANINPLGLPDYLKKLIRDNLDSVLHYPDPKARDLTKMIAKYWNISEENIILGNGSIELIYLLAVAFKPQTALIAAPDFSEYERALTAVNCKIHFLKLKEENNFKPGLAQVKPCDIFIISSPHNPTGNIVISGSDEIERMPYKTIVIDEAFMDFVAEENDYTMIRKAREGKNVLVLRTFTKFFALAGLRAGYLIAGKDTIRMLKRYQAPWSINSLAQISAARLLSDKAYIKQTRYFVEKERAFLFNELSGVTGLKAFHSQVNFILVKIKKKGVDAHSLSARLLKKGIMVRDCGNFRNLSQKFIRVAVRKRNENLRLIKSLKEILGV